MDLNIELADRELSLSGGDLKMVVNGAEREGDFDGDDDTEIGRSSSVNVGPALFSPVPVEASLTTRALTATSETMRGKVHGDVESLVLLDVDGGTTKDDL